MSKAKKHLPTWVPDQVRTPTIPELAARIREREPDVGPSTAKLIRAGRDAR
jgi:hypothetical protein